MSSLEPQSGKRFWRSLDDLADSPDFRRFVEREFPAHADEMLAPASRRGFLKIMGASMALAGMTACRWPSEEILPFAHRPEGYVPGMPLHYATSMDLGGSATGLLVTSYDGRPVKIEGNELHPESGGATSAQAQAAVLELYDPDRSRNVVRTDGDGEINATWEDFERALGQRLDALGGSGGRGLRVLSEATSSPSVADMRDRLLARFPNARWHEYEAFTRDNARQGAVLAFGAPYRVQLKLSDAATVVSLDDDFLVGHPASIRYARELIEGRDPEGGGFGRLHVFESHFSATGSVADHRVAVRAKMMPVLVGCLAARLFLELGLELPAGAGNLRGALEGFRGHALYGAVDLTCADELMSHRGHSAVLAGPGLPPEAHALVQLINVALGNVGATVEYTAEPDPGREHHVDSIAALARDLGSGKVDTLLILGGNPVFNAPAELNFGEALGRAKTSVHLSHYRDETSRLCSWHLPRAHFLESWGDALGHRGAFGVVQPLIEPLANGRSVIELLAMATGDKLSRGYDIVRRTFARRARGDFERAWKTVLHDGILAGSEWPAAVPAVRADSLAEPLAQLAGRTDNGAKELVFMENAGVHDGRFSNNGWLQELPEALTKLTWDNAALLSPSTADELGVGQEDVVRVTAAERSIELPVYVLPGQPAGTIGVALGYGRTSSGRVGDGVGIDAYPLRTGDGMRHVDVTVERVHRQYRLACTQDHFAIDRTGAEESRARVPELVREVELEAFRHDPEHAMHAHEHPTVDLWKEHEYTGHKWGMSIDLNSCIGCNACVVACQAENNIPIVGKDEVANGREMQWIRVDRYFTGEPESAGVSFQPVTCHHCENAPCEQVCPVGATMHDHDGINVMVYNRCVGTRYCLNNCPYKVRRFNFFNNHRNENALEVMVYNPEVTVRSRGVMEKCSFCIQRINAVKIQAKNENRPIRDGEITTACAQACPTRAITFGNLNDPSSRVLAKQKDVRAYAMLEEVNVRPRTRYLARVRNRGPANGTGHSGEA